MTDEENTTEVISLTRLQLDKFDWNDLSKVPALIVENFDVYDCSKREQIYLCRDERTICALFIKQILWALWKHKQTKFYTAETPRILRKITRQLGLGGRVHYERNEDILAVCNIFVLYFRRFVNELKNLDWESCPEAEQELPEPDLPGSYFPL